VPGATYGSETSLEDIGACEVVLGESKDIKYYVAVHAVTYYMGLVCNTQQECEQLAEAIRQAARAKAASRKFDWF